MNITAKKITSYVLAALVVIVTAIAVLAIWDIISLEDVMRKIMTSLLVIFASSVVTLFIFNVVIKDN
ncbi:MAG: hypothetical protein JEZ09_06515 [Salinivirgaceae bacterium]|nr:hypothetical protein [Salinivirgaceae bacterium]